MLVHHRPNQAGFSLVEVIVFVSLISIILIASAGFTVQMLHTMSYNQHKLIASHYTADLKEWLDGEREADWVTFQAFSSVSGRNYCANDPIHLTDSLSNLTEIQGAFVCTFSGITGQTSPLFRRTLRLTSNSEGSSVTAHIEVAWFENGAITSEQIETVYSVWQ